MALLAPRGQRVEGTTQLGVGGEPVLELLGHRLGGGLDLQLLVRALERDGLLDDALDLLPERLHLLERGEGEVARMKREFGPGEISAPSSSESATPSQKPSDVPTLI